MGHQGLKDKVLSEVCQCVLLEVPLTLLAMALNHVEHGLSFTSHVTKVVRPQIVRIQQLVGKLTVSGLLAALMTVKALLVRRISASLSHTAALSTMKFGAKGPRVSASGPTTAPAKRMGPLAHILPS